MITEQNQTTNKKLFTNREAEVLRLIATGKTSKEVAADLFLAIDTVETHRKRMMNKLNVRNFYAVMSYGFIKGILNPDNINLHFITNSAIPHFPMNHNHETA